MAYSTLYQCFNFLARNNGRISLAPDPDDPCKNRCVIKVDSEKDEAVVALTYACTEEMDFLSRVLVPVCKALQEEVE